MPGERIEYVLARHVLLDALEALKEQKDAVILVGAQAIYLHTGEADTNVELLTTDADLAIDPGILKSVPALEEAMRTARFSPTDQPGIWASTQDQITVDLLVPDAVGGPGRRAARLKGHSDKAARKARGLEAALVDHSLMVISALTDTDSRQIEAKVASPSALLVAKLHKIAERKDDLKRRKPKDAFDVYRLLRAISTEDLAMPFAMLLNTVVSTKVTAEAIGFLEELFGTAESLGSQLAARAADVLENPEEIATSCAVLAQDLLVALRK